MRTASLLRVGVTVVTVMGWATTSPLRRSASSHAWIPCFDVDYLKKLHIFLFRGLWCSGLARRFERLASAAAQAAAATFWLCNGQKRNDCARVQSCNGQICTSRLASIRSTYTGQSSERARASCCARPVRVPIHMPTTPAQTHPHTRTHTPAHTNVQALTHTHVKIHVPASRPCRTFHSHTHPRQRNRHRRGRQRQRSPDLLALLTVFVQ
mmetsp:Transcript_40612/g.89160  ORF Transcript_40612/g.89160 Transcript_40612/m.89160 type:complete len:210 (-) Transcript_40612:945-1574(-)